MNNLKTFFITSIPFGMFMGIFLSIFMGIYNGVIGGITSGLIFGLLILIFIKIQEKRFNKIAAEITKGKDIIMQGGATHIMGVEGVGGWLYLTPDEIIFKSHPHNIQVHETIIPLNEIAEAKVFLTAGFIPNGMLIKTKDGKIEKFVVFNRKTWVNKINSKR